MCHTTAGSQPFISGSAAKIEVSLLRPVTTTSAPAVSACWIGSTPIIPTMCVAAPTSASVSGGEGGKARVRPSCRCRRTTSRDISE